MQDISKGNKFLKFKVFYIYGTFNFDRIWHIRQIWQGNYVNKANLPAKFECQKAGPQSWW